MIESCIFYNQHAVVSFGGIVLGSEEGKRIATALGSKNKAVILENHGLLTVGETVDEAAYRHIIMERTCQAQLLAEQAAANGIKKKIICDEDAHYTADALSEPVIFISSFLINVFRKACISISKPSTICLWRRPLVHSWSDGIGNGRWSYLLGEAKTRCQKSNVAATFRCTF